MNVARGAAVGLAAVPLTALVVLGVEVQLARIQPAAIYGAPLRLSGSTGPIGGAGEPPLRVTWLGDSTAAGVGASGVAGALPWQVAQLDGPEVITSLSVSGARVADVVHTQLKGVPADSQVVVISVGANDVAHGARVSTFRRQYERLLQRLPVGASVVMLGVPDMGSPPRVAQPLRAILGWRGRAFDAAVRSLARAHGAEYVDIAGATGRQFRSHPKDLFFADRYHPNDRGYGLWAQAVTPGLTRARARARARA